MKKIKQLVLIGSFSVCAVSLTAQNNAPHHKHPNMRMIKTISPKHIIVNNHSNTKRPTAVTTASLQYPYSDMNLQSAYTLSLGWSTESINLNWTVADTANGNYDLSHSATVAFDTILDIYSGKSYIPTAGTLSVDTLSAVVSYNNTSGINDTAVFVITNVLADGYPGTTVLYTDTVFLNQGVHGLPGNNDSLYELSVIPNFTIPTGYKFAVTLEFKGAKTDSLSFGYAYPYVNCSSSGYDYANTFTFIGEPLGPNPACNSYVTGWEYYEYPTFATTTWPNSHGNQQGSFLGSNAFDNDEWDMCGTDTEYFYWQDNAIFASVSFTDATGVSTISDNGFSISQNSPNPFTKTSLINYDLIKPSDVVFTVNDITGRELVNNKYTMVSPGKHQITLDATKFKAGVYFYSFNINGTTETRKMVIE
jgi:hypothetical protein